MIDLYLLRAWLRLECIEIGPDDRLRRIEGVTCDDLERILAVKSGDEHHVYLREGDPPEAIDARSMFVNAEKWAAQYGITEIRREKTYRILGLPDIKTPDVTALGDTPENFDVFSVMRDGQAVSSAWSVRRNADAAEIAVETLEPYRRRGYGKQVVAAWVRHQVAQEKIAIYSHRTGNLESEALARSCAAVLFAETVSYY